MREQYDVYLEKHKANVKRAFEWIRDNLPELLIGDYDYEWQIVFNHDASKTKPSEYIAYDNYFYGEDKSDKITEEFKKAWLLHIHRNPHHWQFWVLLNDDPKEGEVVLDMPYNDILEMICDWWSFSWEKGNLDGIFEWYNEHKDYMKLSDATRKTVEDILEKIRAKFDESGPNAEAVVE